MEELQHERARVAELERERRELFEELARAAAGNEYRVRDTETERRYLDALEQYAIQEEATPSGPRDLALEALEASGERWDRPHAAAFRLLRRLGRLQDDDENLQIRRFNLRTDFDEPVLAQARVAVQRGPAAVDRTDLTDLTTFSIDGPSTREIDDALSVEDRGGGSARVGVHIADPSAFIEVGDLLDEDALARGVTHYFPDRRLTMIPAEISETAASLLAGERRPALSFMIEMDAAGAIAGFEVLRSWIRSDARFDYQQADRMIGETGSPVADLLAVLDRVAKLREAARIAAGAIVIEAPEVDLHVAADGVISLERSERDSPSRRIVSEAMVLAGEVGAEFCRREALPAIFRRQDAPSFRVEIPAPGGWDAVSVRAVRRSLKRAEIGLQPGRHASLGLDAYAQVTSPLRRYQDLACHRQIAARLAGEEPPYDADAMQRVAATTERAETDARKAERNRDDFWMVRYLDARVGETVEATVVDVQPRTVVQLEETLWEQPMPSVKGVEPGERIRVQRRAGQSPCRPARAASRILSLPRDRGRRGPSFPGRSCGDDVSPPSLPTRPALADDRSGVRERGRVPNPGFGDGNTGLDSCS